MFEHCQKLRSIRFSAVSFFNDLKRKKAALLSKSMLSYIDNLLEGFDDDVDVDPIAITELEATQINDISNIVILGETLGCGRRMAIFQSEGGKWNLICRKIRNCPKGNSSLHRRSCGGEGHFENGFE